MSEGGEEGRGKGRGEGEERRDIIRRTYSRTAEIDEDTPRSRESEITALNFRISHFRCPPSTCFFSFLATLLYYIGQGTRLFPLYGKNL